jgi:hypothetical protein
MMAIIAIGDVHGNIRALNDLLTQLEREIGSDDTSSSWATTSTEEPIRGDCIDRIIDSRKA